MNNISKTRDLSAPHKCSAVLCRLACLVFVLSLAGCSDGESETIDTLDKTCAQNPAHVCCSPPHQGTPCCLPETYEEPACFFELLCTTDPTNKCCVAGAEADPCCQVATSQSKECTP